MHAERDATRTRGRPTDYSPELAGRISAAMLERDADGRTMSLHAICEREGMPHEATVHRWLKVHADFRELYARAREMRGDMIAEEVLAIADGAGTPDEKRVRIDARKWYAAKLNPKHFGDRVVQEHVGRDGAAIEIRDTASEARGAALLLVRAAQQAKARRSGDAQNE